jgi:hypothetical protein
MRSQDLDATLDDLIASCSCDACERYRRWFVARAAYWAVHLEQSLKPRKS